MKVTIFKNVYEKNDPHHIGMTKALQRIQEGNSKLIIDQIREGDKDKELIVRKVLEVVELNHSNLTIDEHKRQYRKQMSSA